MITITPRPLFPGKGPPVPIEEFPGWAKRQILTLWKRKV